MSKTASLPYDPLTWKQADTDVHVATRDGEFAGFVEFDGTAHLVHDHQGAELGAYPTLDGAFAALEDSQEPATRAPLFPLTLPRMLRRRPRRARA